MKKLCEKINYFFKNESLLSEALTHPSLTNKACGKNYQRLEFLGDKVLSLVVGEFLMAKYPGENEGDLSKRQAAFVSGETLAEIAQKINLGDFLKLSLGEEKMAGRVNKRNLENTLEALIGAIYLDSDYENAKKFIFEFWAELFDKNLTVPKDPVSLLQEIVQSKTKNLPQYEIAKSGGSEHDPQFEARVVIKDFSINLKTVGKTKKDAQKKVAKMALGVLGVES